MGLETRDNLAAMITADEAVDLEAEVVMITAIATPEAQAVEETIDGKMVAAAAIVEVAMAAIKVAAEINHSIEMEAETEEAVVVVITTVEEEEEVEVGTTIAEEEAVEVVATMIAEVVVDMVLKRIQRVFMVMSAPILE